jgi:hypothetical protein
MMLIRIPARDTRAGCDPTIALNAGTPNHAINPALELLRGLSGKDAQRNVVFYFCIRCFGIATSIESAIKKVCGSKNLL